MTWLHTPPVLLYAVQYADDVQIVVKGKKSDSALLTAFMESHLAVSADWFSSYGMKIDQAKTQLIVHGTKRTVQNVQPVQVMFGSSLIG